MCHTYGQENTGIFARYIIPASSTVALDFFHRRKISIWKISIKKKIDLKLLVSPTQYLILSPEMTRSNDKGSLKRKLSQVYGKVSKTADVDYAELQLVPIIAQELTLTSSDYNNWVMIWLTIIFTWKYSVSLFCQKKLWLICLLNFSFYIIRILSEWKSGFTWTTWVRNTSRQRTCGLTWKKQFLFSVDSTQRAS